MILLDIAWYCYTIPISIVSAINVSHFPNFAIFTATNAGNIRKEIVIILITFARVRCVCRFVSSFYRDSCERNHKIPNYMTLWFIGLHCGRINGYCSFNQHFSVALMHFCDGILFFRFNLPLTSKRCREVDSPVLLPLSMNDRVKV